LSATNSVQFEVFEVSLRSAVLEAEGKLLCSYPGPAIQIPADIFMDKCFLRELSSFLVQMNVDDLPPPMASFGQQPAGLATYWSYWLESSGDMASRQLWIASRNA
jgi:hypothetical protein